MGKHAFISYHDNNTKEGKQKCKDETRHTKPSYIDEELLSRKQQYGFLNHQSLAKLGDISNLWANLMNTISYYILGC